MTTALLPVPIFRAFDSAGDPLAGGLLYTYAANTTTLATTWTDYSGGTPNANPVVLDSTGTATVRCDPAKQYKLVLKDSGGATQWAIDYYQSPAVGSTSNVQVSQYGSVGDGVTDDTAAFAAAMTELGTKGGIINFDQWHYIAGPLTLQDNIILNGVGINVGRTTDGSYTPSNIPSALVINTANTITHMNRCGIQNCLLITPALAPGGTYALPFANAGVGTTAVAAFSGSAVTPYGTGTICDFRLENILALGFAYTYNGLSPFAIARPLFRRVYSDCTNGIHVKNVSEIGRAEDCECWEFTTVQFGAASGLYVRSGTAFYTGSGSTWMRWSDCFEYGWAIGHDVSTCEDVRQIQCGADSPSTALWAHSNIGFQYSGACANVLNVAGKATAQGDCSFKLNASVQNSVNDFKIVAPNCHNSVSPTNGFIHIMQGTGTISDAYFAGDSATSHINLDAGLAAGAVVINGCTHANLGGTNPVGGDATSIANTRILNPIYTGSSSSRQGLVTLSGSTMNTQNADYTTVLSDAGLTIYHSDGTARTYTIDSNANVKYAIGTMIHFHNDASAAVNVTISITTDTMRLSPGGTTGSRTLAQYGTATARKVATTRWTISGFGLT